MKRLPLLLFSALIAFAQPAGSRAVYILPMTGGLDQYLATWLTREKVLQVVADFSAADLVMTDRLGESFEQRLALAVPDPGPDENEAGPARTHTEFRSAHSRGIVFVVDKKSRQVIWSDYEKPGSGAPSFLNRQAQRIVKKLQSAKL